MSELFAGLPTPRFLPFGDAAMLVEFGDAIDRGLSEAVLALDAAVTAAAISGVVETAPSFRSLMIQFDPLATDAEKVERAVREAAPAPLEVAEHRLWTVPVCYGEAFAPDLIEVADHAAISVDEVARRHSAIEHHVYMIGFLPGAPYLGDLPAPLTLPRKNEPRVKIPAGSVAIAMGLTVIYPVESPGGWRIIGKTPVRLFSPEAASPALLRPGDAVRFEPISEADFRSLSVAIAAGAWSPSSAPRRVGAAAS